MWLSVRSGNIFVPIFYLPLCALFCDKNGNFANNQRFLLQTRHGAADNLTLRQHFLKELKARHSKKNPNHFRTKWPLWMWCSFSLKVT